MDDLYAVRRAEPTREAARQVCGALRVERVAGVVAAVMHALDQGRILDAAVNVLERESW